MHIMSGASGNVKNGPLVFFSIKENNSSHLGDAIVYVYIRFVYM